MTFNDAQEASSNLSEYLTSAEAVDPRKNSPGPHKDWRVLTKAQMNVYNALTAHFNNLDKSSALDETGSKPAAYYCSSLPKP